MPLQHTAKEIGEAIDIAISALSEIDKCKPVAEVVRLIGEPMWVNITNYKPLNHGDKLYTSPQPSDCEDWQYFDKAYKKAAETSDATDWMNAALLAQQVRRKQLNTKG